jgi:hypothetical protein
MRVNVFTQLDARHRWVAEWKKDAAAGLDCWFPGLREQVGPFRVTSAVQVVPTMYYRLRSPALPGVVAIGDEYQSVSPATGMGLSKVLTDVDALCTRHAPEWLSTGRVRRGDVRGYYADPEKVACDRKALDAWRYYHDRQLGGRVPVAMRVKRKILR